ncbi:CRTAC1 family protein, partial [bacterium]|nr:CRTAC1 family protein [bacterium]
IEVKWRDDGCALPGRGRSCSGYAIEYIPQKWPTWSSFADATFEDVYGKIDTAAERYDARQLRSQVLLNDGTGKFTGTDLPVDVQLSIAQGIGVGDYDNDGKLDAYIAQNFHWPQPETGRWISGYGVLLQGRGDGSFEALSMARSGINWHKDGRSVVPCDVNSDGCLDIIFSVSNGKPQLCLADKGQSQGSGLLVSLSGKAPNTQAAGAKLTLELSDGTKLTRIVQAGSGMLSSYLGPVHFGIPSGATASRLTVAWPDGSSSESTELAGPVVKIQQ